MHKEEPDQQITVEFDRQFKKIDISLPELTGLVENICRKFRVHRADINILIGDDEKITELNKRFLKRKRTTDCISFDLSDTEKARAFDLVVNGEKAVREAGKRNITEQAELALYITHGLLHNLGFDDHNENSAEKMHRAEDEILKEHGFGTVYNIK